MAIGAYNFFKDKGKIIYVALKDQGKALNFSGSDPIVLNHPISIDEFLVGYGFKIQNSSDLKENLQRAESLFYMAAILAANYTKRSVSEFSSCIFKIAKHNYGWEDGITLDEDDDLFVEDDAIHEALLNHFSLKSNGGWITGELGPLDVQFLTGGWLEVFIWGLLHKLEPNLIQELFIQLKLENIAKHVSNECDIVFMKDKSLFIVECKTGKGFCVPGGEDEVLYKIEAIRKQPGALLVKSYYSVLQGSGLFKIHTLHRC